MERLNNCLVCVRAWNNKSTAGVLRSRRYATGTGEYLSITLVTGYQLNVGIMRAFDCVNVACQLAHLCSIVHYRIQSD